MGQLDGKKCEERPLSPTGRTHSKKMAEPLAFDDPIEILLGGLGDLGVG